MTSDDETSLPLLRLLLLYLKQEKNGRSPATETTLAALYKQLSKLQSKELIPFDSKPLLRLLSQTVTEGTERHNEDDFDDDE